MNSKYLLPFFSGAFSTWEEIKSWFLKKKAEWALRPLYTLAFFFSSILVIYLFFFEFAHPSHFWKAMAVGILFLTLFPKKTLPLIVVTSFIFAFLFFGYNSFGFNQAQYLIQPFKEIFPGFAQTDWFTWEVGHYHFFFSGVIRIIHFVFQGDLALGMYLTWIFFLFLFFHSIYFFVTQARGSVAHYAIILFLFGVTIRSFAFYIASFDQWLLPNRMANPITLYAIGFLVGRKYFLAFLFLGLATVIHVNFGAIGLPIFCLYLLFFEKDLGIKQKIGCLFPFFFVSAPIVLPITLNFGSEGGDPEFFRHLILLRIPIHYLSRYFSDSVIFFTFAPMAYALLSFIFNPGVFKTPAWRFLLLVILMFGIFHSMMVVNGPLIFIRLHIWRLIPIALIISYHFMAMDVLEPFRGIWPKIILFLYFSYWAVKNLGWDTALPFAFIFTLLAVCLHFSQYKTYRKAICGILIITALPLAQAAKRDFTKVPRYTFKKKKSFPSSGLYAWIDRNVPENALFLTPPGSFQNFRMAARRGIIVDFKSTPIGSYSDLREWYVRLNDVAGITPKNRQLGPPYWNYARMLDRAYVRLGPKKVREIMDKYKATHYLTRGHSEKKRKLFAQAGFIEIYARNNTFIYRLEKYPESAEK